MNKQTYISVVIPCYRCSKTIGKTIESVWTQTLRPLEVLLVEDGKDEDPLTSNVLNALEVKYPKEWLKIIRLDQNKGPSFARNIGWENSRGDYISFLDSDDLWFPEKIETITKIINENEKIDLIGHAFSLEQLDVTTRFSDNRLVKKTLFDLVLKNIAATPCVTIKKTVNEKFNNNMLYNEDHDLWLRMATLRYQLYYTSIILTKLSRPVLSQGGLSQNKLKMRLGEIQMYLNLVCKKKRLMLFLPFLICFSVGKHIYKAVRGFYF